MKNEYAKLPWSVEDTIENLKEIKELFKGVAKIRNLDGKGEEDAKEIDFDFDRAIEALEKQIPKKPTDITKVRDGEGYIGLIGKCPCCDEILEEDTVYCECGQKLDWGD